MGKITAAPLKQGARFDHSRNAATALRTIPLVNRKSMAIERFKPLDDARLQSEKVLLSLVQDACHRVDLPENYA
jgi:hypothetical protein